MPFAINTIKKSPLGGMGVFLSLFFVLISLCANAQNDSLRISILGDSYSTFYGCVVPDTNAIWYFPDGHKSAQKGNDVRKVEQTWWHQVVKRLGAKLERNNAYSGATICYTGYRPAEGKPHADYSDRAFITRSNWLGNPDVILVCGATNDSWCGAPIGDYVFGNWTNKQLYSFRPAMAKLLYDLKGNYPMARIVFILNSELKDEINESVHTICKHYNVPCLDLHNIDKQWGHPSVAGMKSFADQVVEFLKK